MNKVSLYLHIPFCQSKCFYCDFISFSKLEKYHQTYVDVLCMEIEQVGETLQDYEIDTIFIGGGTPSILSAEQIDMILKALEKSFKLTKNAEITMECNPGTLNEDKIDVIAKGIINRVSLGLQSTNNKLLKKIGRIHTFEMFLDNYSKLRKAGIHNINIDVMFGLPGQTSKGYLEELKIITELAPEHISSYGLIIEEGTPFYNLYQNGQLKIPEETIEREMYDICITTLKTSGYKHYEISNFSKPEFACRHNLVYWDLKPYIGLGLAAHSYFNEQRYENTKDLTTYIKRGLKGEFTKEKVIAIHKKDKMEEFMFLGLRKIEGVTFQKFKETFNLPIEEVFGLQIQSLIRDELIQVNNHSIALSRKGFDVANRVFSEFLLDDK